MPLEILEQLVASYHEAIVANDRNDFIIPLHEACCRDLSNLEPAVYKLLTSTLGCAYSKHGYNAPTLLLRSMLRQQPW